MVASCFAQRSGAEHCPAAAPHGRDAEWLAGKGKGTSAAREPNDTKLDLAKKLH